MSATPRRILRATNLSPTGARVRRTAAALAGAFEAGLRPVHLLLPGSVAESVPRRCPVPLPTVGSGVVSRTLDNPACAGDEGAETPDVLDNSLTSDPEPARGIELVVGLGNPGERYAATRHNMGYLVVEELASRLRAAPWSHRPLCDVTSAPLGPRLLLARPLTFMNRSGAAVAWLLDHLDLDPPRMLVVLDDVDLDLGTLRLRRSGGPGTHNGLRDVCERIGTAFPRLRLGVRGSDPWQDLAEYVLSPFADDEQPLARRLVTRAADAAEAAVREGLEPAMGRFNGPAPVDVDGG